MGKNRLDYIDIAKGIAIIAVVLMHINYPFPSSTFVPIRALLGYGWHVATFFIIGGFFIKEERLESCSSFIKSKIRSLYSLSLYFYIPAVLLHNIFLDIGWYDPRVEYGGKYIEHYNFYTIVRSLIECLLCAGREPILGAMWFVNVLFLALCCMSIIMWLLNKIIHKKYYIKQYIYPTFLLLLALIACSLTRDAQFNIPRFNNVFTAMWLIYVGFWVRNKWHVTFDNPWVAAICVLVLAHFFMTYPMGVDLNRNQYADLITLTVGTMGCVYALCFISQKIPNNYIGFFLRKCGEDSFYIMALHFVGFKIGIYMLNAFGYGISLCSLTPQTQGEWLLVPYYVFWGIIIPLIFMYLFRKIKFFLTTYHR